MQSWAKVLSLFYHQGQEQGDYFNYHKGRAYSGNYSISNE